MKWYYVEGGQQQGPVSDAELEGKSRAGAITPETLVWREGMANWQPFEPNYFIILSILYKVLNMILNHLQPYMRYV
jgi:hypothetical protein